MIKSDSDSINAQYVIQTVHVELQKVRRNSLLKSDQPRSAILKQISQNNNNSYVYIHCSALNYINQSPKI